MGLDLAGEKGRLIFDGELEHVLNKAGIDSDIEANVAAGNARGMEDRALGDDVGVEQPRVNGLEVSVAVGAVDDGVESGFERQGAFGDVEAEVRRVGGAIDDDAAELALVLAVGGEDAADALDGAEVGVTEGVTAADGRVARAVGVEGAKVAGGVNVADRSRVDEGCVEAHRLAGGDGAQLNFIDDEVERDFAGLAVFDDEVSAFDVDFVDEDFDLAVALIDTRILILVLTLLWVRHVSTLGLWREMDVEAGDLDAVDDEGSVEELMPVVDPEREMVNGDHRLGAVEVVGVEFEAGTGDLESTKERGMELVELDAAVEAGAEGLDDFGLEHGAGAMQEDVGGDDGCDDEDGDDGDGPEENEQEDAMAPGAREGRGWPASRSTHSFHLLMIMDLGQAPRVR